MPRVHQRVTDNNAYGTNGIPPINCRHFSHIHQKQGPCCCRFVCVQLLKENLVGQELDGKPWAPGNKTKDILIADYRYDTGLLMHPAFLPPTQLACPCPLLHHQ
jgi:hypothetical protein